MRRSVRRLARNAARAEHSPSEARTLMRRGAPRQCPLPVLTPVLPSGNEHDGRFGMVSHAYTVLARAGAIVHGDARASGMRAPEFVLLGRSSYKCAELGGPRRRRLSDATVGVRTLTSVSTVGVRRRSVPSECADGASRARSALAMRGHPDVRSLRPRPRAKRNFRVSALLYRHDGLIILRDATSAVPGFEMQSKAIRNKHDGLV